MSVCLLPSNDSYLPTVKWLYAHSKYVYIIAHISFSQNRHVYIVSYCYDMMDMMTASISLYDGEDKGIAYHI